MGRVPAVVTGTPIASVAFGNALITDYVSQTDAAAQTIASNLNVTGALQKSGSNVEVQGNKGAASGYCGLDAGTKVATVNLGGAGADNTKYLRGDQTWVAPPGAGDMTKAVYDTDADNIVESADNAHTVDGSHAAAFEVSGTSAIHAALTTGTHGAGASTLATTANIKPILCFAVSGILAVDTDVVPTILAPYALTILKVKLVVKTAPTDANLIVDVNKNGVTIFTTQGNRPTILDGETTEDSSAPDVTALAEDDKVTVDIDQVGATVKGSDLTIQVICQLA